MSDGTSSYGLEISGPNGTTNVFGSNLRQINAVLLATATLGAVNSNTASVSYNGIAEATDSTKIGVFLAADSPSYLENQGASVSRTTANGGTITLTNQSPNSVTLKVSIYRIA